MSARDDGGPAFPRAAFGLPDDGEKFGNGAQSGMTLRDYFAAKAMQAALASTDDKAGWPHQEVRAAAFYAWADAMLKARAK